MTYIKFHEYREQREIIDFDTKFTAICEGIAHSGMTFDDFWREHGLPVLINSVQYENVNELMEAWYNPFSWFGGGGQSGVDVHKQNQQAQAGQFFGDMEKNDPVNQANAAREKKLGQFQQKADQMVQNIKQRFSVAMKDFLKSVTDDAKTQNDPHMWKIAQSFHQRIMQAAQPVIQSFSMKARSGKADYAQQFGTERDAMMQGQQKTRTDALKQRLQAGKRPGALGNDKLKGGLDKARVGRGGTSNDEMMQQAQELVAKNPGFTIEKLSTQTARRHHSASNT